MEPRITDTYVNKYLKQNHPEVAAGFTRESRSINEQRLHEVYAGSAQDYVDEVQATEVACRDIHRHWIYSVAPGLGGEDIMAMVRPLLTDEQYACLRSHAINGESQQQAAASLGVSRWYVQCRIAEARAAILLARPEILSNTREQVKTRFEYWKSLQQQNITIYHKPSRGEPVKAYVCDCGRHLIKDRHANLQVYKGRSKLVCDCCGKSYTESEWRGIYC